MAQFSSLVKPGTVILTQRHLPLLGTHASCQALGCGTISVSLVHIWLRLADDIRGGEKQTCPQPGPASEGTHVCAWSLATSPSPDPCALSGCVSLDRRCQGTEWSPRLPGTPAPQIFYGLYKTASAQVQHILQPRSHPPFTHHPGFIEHLLCAGAPLGTRFAAVNNSSKALISREGSHTGLGTHRSAETHIESLSPSTH